jgi:transporter family protein
MSSSWIFLALASAAMSAVVNTIDSHFIARRMPGLRSYLLVIGIFTLLISISMLIIFPMPDNLEWRPLGMAIGSSVLRTAAVSLLLYLMQKEEVARIMPLGSTAPVFVAILALLFLGERLELIQWLAIAIVAGGAVLISFRPDSAGTARFHAKPFLVMLASSLLFAISDVANKYALNYMSFWNSASISLFVSSALFTLVCWRGRVVKATAKLKRPWLTIVLINLNQILAMSSMIIGFWAIQMGSVSLASTIFNSKPMFVFLYTIILGWLFPGFLLDRTADRKGMVIKLLATSMIVGGVAIIFLA